VYSAQVPPRALKAATKLFAGLLQRAQFFGMVLPARSAASTWSRDSIDGAWSRPRHVRASQDGDGEYWASLRNWRRAKRISGDPGA